MTIQCPRRGRREISVYDVRDDGPGRRLLPPEAMQICEACGVREIRHVHVLEHHDYDGCVEVGRECAALMCNLPAEAVARREAPARNRSARRETFCSNKNWTETRDKNGFRLRHQNYVYTLKRTKYGSYCGSFIPPGGSWVRVDGFFKDLDEAKLVLFDAAFPAARRPSHPLRAAS